MSWVKIVSETEIAIGLDLKDFQKLKDEAYIVFHTHDPDLVISMSTEELLQKPEYEEVFQ